jgi:hypothetical protein
LVEPFRHERGYEFKEEEYDPQYWSEVVIPAKKLWLFTNGFPEGPKEETPLPSTHSLESSKAIHMPHASRNGSRQPASDCLPWLRRSILLPCIASIALRVVRPTKKRPEYAPKGYNQPNESLTPSAHLRTKGKRDKVGTDSKQRQKSNCNTNPIQLSAHDNILRSS